jgi:RHS repeat-associated protein
MSGQSWRNSTQTSKNDYLYNGKEFQDELGLDWYDYRARFYDPVLGRFPSIDPMIEEHYDYTGYAYVYNNPVNLIDPFGLDSIKPTVLPEVEVTGKKPPAQQATRWFPYIAESTPSPWQQNMYNFSSDYAKANFFGFAMLTTGGAAFEAGLGEWVYVGGRWVLKRLLRKGLEKGKNNYGKFKSKFTDHVEEIRSDLGIPKNWLVKPEKNGEGIKFYDPANAANNHVRVSPGEYANQYPTKQVPNVKWYKNGSPMDVNGNSIRSSTGQGQNTLPEVHIPYDKFKYIP